MATSTTAAAKMLKVEASLIAKPSISLDQRIQNLPQELQDEIKEMFIATSGRIEIANYYDPPIGLQLDHKTRERFAKTFYKAHFVYNVDDVAVLDEGDCYDMLDRWLRSISAAHRLLIEKIEVVVEDVVEADEASNLKGHMSGRGGSDAFLEDEHSWLQRRYWDCGPRFLVRGVVFAMRLTVMEADGFPKEVTMYSED